MGDDHFLYASDIPHWDNEFPENLSELRDHPRLSRGDEGEDPLPQRAGAVRPGIAGAGHAPRVDHDLRCPRLARDPRPPPSACGSGRSDTFGYHDEDALAPRCSTGGVS